MSFIKNSICLSLVAIGLVACDRKVDPPISSPSSSTSSVSTASQAEELFTAVLANEVGKVQKLVNKKADLTVKDGRGNTALHLASESGALEVVKALVKGQADIDAQNSDGQTPLMRAASSGQTAVIQYLLRHNASPDLKDNEGYRPITLAANAGNNASVEALALYSRNYLDDALFIASLKGHDDMINTLTNYGASVYARIQKDGRTPLMMAAQNGHKESARILLENGANRYSTDNNGLTASQLARASGHFGIAGYLGGEPVETDFSLQDEGQNVLRTAVKQVVSIENAAVAAGSSQETPLAQTLKVISLNGTQVSLRNGKLVDALTFKAYREESLPLQIYGVEANVVSLKYLYGDHRVIQLSPGDTIPGTDLKIISASVKRDQSKMSATGVSADVSTVVVEDTTTGQQKTMTTGLNVNRMEPFAIVKDFSSDALLVARKGDRFSSADGTEYNVLEVRSSQLIVAKTSTGEVFTIKK